MKVYRISCTKQVRKLILSSVDAFIQRLHITIDHAMAVTYRRNPHDPQNNTYVSRITLCKGVPFYGFHVGWKFFLKIYMLNPAYMQRLADLLRNGSIMGKTIQPYEVHIPYLLQFMADYGLYGCGWVSCSKVSFRSPVPPASLSNDINIIKYDDSTIAPHLISYTTLKPRLSHCALELDLLAQDIINRKTITPRYLHHDFIERAHPPSLDEKLVHSMAELWRDDERRRERKGESSPHTFVFTARHQADPEMKGPWIHEREMRQKIEEIVRAERAKSDARMLNFDTFVQQSKFHDLVQTALESVTDMFISVDIKASADRENYVGLGSSSGHIRENSREFPSADIDEGRIQALLRDIDSDNAALNRNDDSLSASDSASPSDVDFDTDLLGRVQGEELQPDNLVTDVNPFDYRKTPPRDSHSIAFSDDLDLDFDSNVSADPSRGLQRAVGSSHDASTKFEEPNNVPTDFKGHDAGPLRLRGGAASPDRGQRKRAVNEYTESQALKKARIMQVGTGAGDRLATRSIEARQYGVTYQVRRNDCQMKSQRSLNLNTSSELMGLSEDTGTTDSSFARSSFSPLAAHDERIRQRFEQKSDFEGPLRYLTSLQWRIPCPNVSALLAKLHSLNIPQVIPRSAYYSRNEDVPATTREYAGKGFRLVSDSLLYLPLFKSGTDSTPIRDHCIGLMSLGLSHKRLWKFERKPPHMASIRAYAQTEAPYSSIGDSEAGKEPSGLC